ncbi:MAG: TIGR04211 family SH3 domain-containing protein [Halopseudomonas sp.]
MRNGLFLLVLFVSGMANGADYHISDKVAVFMHTGPSNQYRIKSNLPSGTMLDVLAKDASTGYVKVRLEKGTEGWVEGKYVDKGQSLAQRLPVLEKALARSRQLTDEQSEALVGLESDLTNANNQQAQYTAEVSQLQNEVERLKLEIGSMDETNLMGWFIRGGALALGGLIIGLIVPHLPKRRQRNNDWF